MTKTREITEHAVNKANEAIKIIVSDEKGAGGANHVYSIKLPPNDKNEEMITTIAFQNGPILEAGVNGLTHEVLLAIVADRLRAFQDGPFACRENGVALAGVLQALDNLKARTKNRTQRGVEGTNKP